MKIKVLFIILCSVSLIGGIWLKKPNRQQAIVLTQPLNTHQKLDTENAITVPKDKYLSSTMTTKIKLTKTSKLITEIAQPLDKNKSSQPTLEIFTGNSSYTGDDTTDNDAGNLGFEDDFPEAKFTYDDHAAEGYTNYTESYAD